MSKLPDLQRWTHVADEGGDSINDGPKGYLEKVLSVYGPLVSYVPDGD